jgi:hypothetical protein
VIAALLVYRIYKTGVIHNTQPEQTHPAADSGVRA